MNHFRPQIVSSKDVFNTLGRHWKCPYCNVEHTGTPPDIGWVKTTLRQSDPPYICLGCCEDIYSTCASQDFIMHAYRDIVEEAAAIEGLSVNDFRRICLLDQLDVAKIRLDEELKGDQTRRSRIEMILREIEQSEESRSR